MHCDGAVDERLLPGERMVRVGVVGAGTITTTTTDPTAPRELPRSLELAVEGLAVLA